MSSDLFYSYLGIFEVKIIFNNEIHMALPTVARMCHNSVVVGTKVYIEADDAGNTTLSSGVSCTCNVTTQVGKQMEVKLKFNGTSNQM